MIVPTYNNQQNINGGMISGGVQTAGQLSPSLGKNMIGAVGKEVAAIGARITLAYDRSVLSSNSISLQKDLSDLQLSYKDRSDYQNFHSDYKGKVAELRDKYTALSPSKAIQRAFTPVFDKAAETGYKALNGLISTKQVQEAKGRYIQDRNNLMELSARAQSPEAVSQYIEQNSKILQDRVNDGLINAVDYAVNDASFKNEAQSNFANELIHREPVKALAMLQDKAKFPGLQEKTRNILINKATVAAKDADTTAVYQKVANKYPGDPLKAGQYIVNPDNISKLGIDIKQAGFLKTVFDGEYNQQRQVSAAKEKASREMWSAKINEAIMGGNLLEASRMIGESNLKGETKRRIFDGIKKREYATNPRKLVSLYAKIDNGQITERSQIDRELGHGVGPQDVVKLNSYLKESNNEGKDKHNYFNDVRARIVKEAKDHSSRGLTALRPEFELLVRQEAKREKISKYDPKILEIANNLLEFHSKWDDVFGGGTYQFQKGPQAPKAPTAQVPETKSDPKREKAIKILEDNNKAVSEASIKYVMEHDGSK